MALELESLLVAFVGATSDTCASLSELHARKAQLTAAKEALLLEQRKVQHEASAVEAKQSLLAEQVG
jgi:hypothetical protein